VEHCPKPAVGNGGTFLKVTAMSSGNFGIGLIELIILAGMSLLFFAFIPICCWKIVEKTGYPAWWSLAALLPGVNLALLIMLAFGDWPALKDQSADDGQN